LLGVLRVGIVLKILVTAVLALAAAWVALASAAGSTIVPDADAVAEAGSTVVGTVPRSEVLGHLKPSPSAVIGSEAQTVLKSSVWSCMGL